MGRPAPRIRRARARRACAARGRRRRVRRRRVRDRRGRCAQSRRRPARDPAPLLPRDPRCALGVDDPGTGLRAAALHRAHLAAGHGVPEPDTAGVPRAARSSSSGRTYTGASARRGADDAPRRRSSSSAADARGYGASLLIVLPPLAVLATPYGPVETRATTTCSSSTHRSARARDRVAAKRSERRTLLFYASPRSLVVLVSGAPAPDPVRHRWRSSSRSSARSPRSAASPGSRSRAWCSFRSPSAGSSIGGLAPPRRAVDGVSRSVRSASSRSQ